MMHNSPEHWEESLEHYDGISAEEICLDVYNFFENHDVIEKDFESRVDHGEVVVSLGEPESAVIHFPTDARFTRSEDEVRTDDPRKREDHAFVYVKRAFFEWIADHDDYYIAKMSTSQPCIYDEAKAEKFWTGPGSPAMYVRSHRLDALLEENGVL